jgi:hypothetical protein
MNEFEIVVDFRWSSGYYRIYADTARAAIKELCSKHLSIMHKHMMSKMTVNKIS